MLTVSNTVFQHERGIKKSSSFFPAAEPTDDPSQVRLNISLAEVGSPNMLTVLLFHVLLCVVRWSVILWKKELL
jgi:hypothetical protein